MSESVRERFRRLLGGSKRPTEKEPAAQEPPSQPPAPDTPPKSVRERPRPAASSQAAPAPSTPQDQAARPKPTRPAPPTPQDQAARPPARPRTEEPQTRPPQEQAARPKPIQSKTTPPRQPTKPAPPASAPVSSATQKPDKPPPPATAAAPPTPTQETPAPQPQTASSSQAEPNEPPRPAAPPPSRLLQWAQRSDQAASSSASARRPRPTQPAKSPPLLDKKAPDPDEFKTPSDARAFLTRLRTKTNQTIQDFAEGNINQRQFQAIYSHYQKQRQAVEKALIEMPGSGAWRQAAVEGRTTLLRQQYAARLTSYAIYETSSGMPLAQQGDFQLDPALVVPMLSSFRSITQEIFGGGIRRTEIEGGRWLCFVPGEKTTLIAIFQEEPATLQLGSLEDLHRDFEFIYETAEKRGEDISQLGQVFAHLWAPDVESS